MATAGPYGSRDNQIGWDNPDEGLVYSICGGPRTLKESYQSASYMCNYIDTGGSCCNNAVRSATACKDSDGTVCTVLPEVICNDVCKG